MNKRVELPLTEPIYSAYHYQGSVGVVLYANPSIRNWYLNEVMILVCDRKFLFGYTTPTVSVASSEWQMNPYLEKVQYPMRFAKGNISSVIREFLDQGYYVYFTGVDDYYVKGKSWYHQKHFNHDGIICGYDQDKRTYSLCAYDSNWIYGKFETPQKSFHEGRKAMLKKEIYGTVFGFKPKQDQILFDPKKVYKKLIEYLDSSFEKYPADFPELAYGTVVHDYIALYLDKLLNGSIPYERMDRRVFRLIWEHKKFMLERLQKCEAVLNLNPEISTAYSNLVSQADAMRMLYASYHIKRRDSILPILQKKILGLKEQETILLTQFIERIGGVIE